MPPDEGLATAAPAPEADTAPAAKLEEPPEEATVITTGEKKLSRRVKAIDDDEPLVDTTVAIPKRSKKTERAIKRHMKKQQKLAQHRGPATLQDLPPELLEAVLSYLRPSDILHLLPVNRRISDFILTNEGPIARSIIRRRYPILAKCFPLPQPLDSVPADLQPALLSEPRQNLLQIHKRPYQHVQPIDPSECCTCMTCMLAWNNLNTIVDLAHWQPYLTRRDPITMIPRGTNPQWNQDLLASNAALVSTAMLRPLIYALILEHHLTTTTATLLRTLRGQKTVHPKRVYHLSKPAVEAGLATDVFLEGEGPECHEFPYHRDNYYNLNAYLPNRKWVRNKDKDGKREEGGRWVYYALGSHERDLVWVGERFGREVERAKAKGVGEGEKGMDEFAAHFQAQASLLVGTPRGAAATEAEEASVFGAGGKSSV